MTMVQIISGDCSLALQSRQDVFWMLMEFVVKPCDCSAELSNREVRIHVDYM